MGYENRLSHRTLIRVGAACLLGFNLLHWFLHPASSFWRDVADGAGGFLLGITIATFCLAVRMMARGDNGLGGAPCA